MRAKTAQDRQLLELIDPIAGSLGLDVVRIRLMSGAKRQRLVETRIRFKRLSAKEMEAYLASAEWRDKAGGYAIQGIAGAFVVKLVGSYSAVVGLPLNETVGLLAGEGYPVHFNWLNQSTLTAV